VSAASRDYAKSERGREVNKAAVSRYRERHPDRAAAQNALLAAVRRGDLVKPATCQAIGCECTVSLHGHHVRYDQPLTVAWLCSAHQEHVHHVGPLRLKPGAMRKVARAPKPTKPKDSIKWQPSPKPD
jgi:hypothetical protein